jgi:hypothetical protein
MVIISNMTILAGDSIEQRNVEKWMIHDYSKKHEVILTNKKRLDFENGSWIELDGYCESPLILCEAWAHIGSPKSAQKHKVMTDAFKLLYANAHIKGNSKLILLFADKEAALFFQGKNWMAQCLKEHNVAVEITELPPERKNEVLIAQKRQYR